MSLGTKRGGGINPRMLLFCFHSAKSGKAPTDFSEVKLFFLSGSIPSLDKFACQSVSLNLNFYQQNLFSSLFLLDDICLNLEFMKFYSWLP